MMTKFEFRRLVKQQIRLKSNAFLSELKDKHSKTQKLQIQEKIADYLVNKNLSTSHKKLLFLLRCRMSKEKNNYKQMHTNLVCRLCVEVDSVESLEHLSVCSFVHQHVPEITTISVDDIYSDVEVKMKAVKIWSKVFEYLEDSNNQAHDYNNCASCTVIS